MVAPIIDVADDLRAASGRWYLWQPCTVATDSGPGAVWLTGTYADRYAKGADGWKFSEVQLDCQTVSPVDEGWVRRPFWNE